MWSLLVSDRVFVPDPCGDDPDGYTLEMAVPAKKIPILDMTKALSAYGALNVTVPDQVYLGSDSHRHPRNTAVQCGIQQGAGVKLSIA
ncbi:hypothetical protein [Mycobacteroides sp. LB1]|uniref:hypothetical protein n=1 Tax=Mycobacteroides sp. LB1 TaxID=2750814 RepID=UPI0015DED989|nr:hypothetical protein [Mycobacteroides sp. LB1]